MASPEDDQVAAHALAVPVFRRYVVGRGIVIFGNALSLVALPLLAYQMTGSATLTALVASTASLPYLVFGLLAGSLANRWLRRRVMVRAGLASGLVLGTVPIASVASVLTYPHLVVAALAVSTLFVFSDAAAFGVIPQMVGRERLASATAFLMILATGIGLVGPAVAGVLVTVFDPALVIGLDAAAYLVVAGILARMRWSDSEVRPPRVEDATLRGDIAEGLRFMWRTRLIRWLTIFGFGASLTLGGVTGLLVVIGVEQLSLAQDSHQLGWLYAANAAGTLTGSALLPSLQARFGVGRITVVGLGLALVALMTLSTVRDLGAALVLVALFQIPTMALILNGMVARAVMAPDELQSRVNTTGRMIAGGGMPFGAVLAGGVADVAGTPWALRAAGVGMLVSLVGALAAGVQRYPRLATMAVESRADARPR